MNAWQWFLTYPQLWATLSLLIVILLVLVLATVRVASIIHERMQAETDDFRRWLDRARNQDFENL